jgi:hypothetical protein
MVLGIAVLALVMFGAGVQGEAGGLGVETVKPFAPLPSLYARALVLGYERAYQEAVVEDWSDADFAVVDPQATPKTVTITIRVVQPPDFFLLVSPTTLDIYPGASASFVFTIQPQAGYDKVTHLAVTSALPTGWTASFSTVDVAAGGSSTLTITTPANAALGPVPFEVTATEIF